jgi:hypothetical protein
VPPLQLLLLLIHIAARIAAGHTVQSDASSSASKNEGEDDFGIPTTPGVTAHFNRAVKDDDSDATSDLD